MKKIISKIIIFFVTLFGLKKKYLLDNNGRVILDSNYKPIREK